MGLQGSSTTISTSGRKRFIEVLQQAKATTVGTITEAGLESEAADAARALWRCRCRRRMAVSPSRFRGSGAFASMCRKSGAQVKVSNVGFVP